MLPAFYFGQHGVCTYCGETASVVDHVFPLSTQTTINRKYGKKLRNAYGPLTYACGECNNWLSNKWFDSFLDRCHRVSIHFDALAKPVVFGQAEIAGLDYTLRSLVAQKTAKSIRARWRADWFESPDFIRNIEELECIAVVRTHVTLAAYFQTTLEMIREYYERWARSSKE